MERNRDRQKLRDRRRRIQLLAKNNLALDLKHSAAEVWLVGSGVKDLAKNNLGSTQVFIFQQLDSYSAVSSRACKEHPSGGPTQVPVYTASGSC